MMTRRLHVFSLMLVLLSAFAHADGGGDHVRNGGGTAEQNVTFAWQILPASLNNCSADTQCLNAAGGQAGLQSLNGLRENSVDTLIQFSSAKLHPQFFKSDASGRFETMSTLTGNLTAPIYVNLDNLYRNDAQGILIPFTVANASAWLVRELGEKLNLNSIQLNNLQSAFQGYLDRTAKTLQVSTLQSLGRPEVRLLSLASGELNPVYLDDGAHLFPLAALIAQQSPCTEMGMSLSNLQLGSFVWLQSAVWQKYNLSVLLSAQTNVELQCVDASGLKSAKYFGSLQVDLPMQVKKKSDGSIVQDMSAVNLIQDSKYSLIPVLPAIEVSVSGLHE